MAHQEFADSFYKEESLRSSVDMAGFQLLIQHWTVDAAFNLTWQ